MPFCSPVLDCCFCCCCCRTHTLAKNLLLHAARIRFRRHFLLLFTTFNWSLPQALAFSAPPVVTIKGVIWHNWGTALQGYITSQGWSRWPGRPGCPRRPRESGSGGDHDAQDVRQDEEDRAGHPDHWDNKLTLEARTLHIANRRTTRRT